MYINNIKIPDNLKGKIKIDFPEPFKLKEKPLNLITKKPQTMKYDLDVLNKYVEDGLLMVTKHKTYPLYIYNYTRTAQYGGLWDDVTINFRGNILDESGNLVAKSFPKFKNIEEYLPTELPNEDFNIYEKMDGSLGIAYFYDNKWNMATRKCFYSDQAIKGLEILNRFDTSLLDVNYTYLFEIIYPNNWIIVRYNEEKLVLLAKYNVATGEEGDVQTDYYKSNFDVVKCYDNLPNNFGDLKRSIEDNKEGYVLRFKNGMRVKMKSEEYVKLHKILTNVSNMDIWLYMKNGEDLSLILDAIPDEMDNNIRDFVDYLKMSYNIVYNTALDFYENLLDENDITSKKDFALLIKDLCPNNKALLFAFWDKKEYENIIWNIVKPDEYSLLSK
jgi:RNA ligase